MTGGLIAGIALDGIVRAAIWPESQQLYVVSIPDNIGVGRITNVTFITFNGGTIVNNTNITLDGAAIASGVTDKNGMAEFMVNATTNGSINVTAEKQGFHNGTSLIIATPGLIMTSSPASITSGTATYVNFSVTGMNKPVEGATVNLTGAGIDLEGITTSDGKIIMQVNAPSTGRIIASAKKTGYADDSTVIMSTGRQTLSVSSTHSSLTINVPVYVTFTVTAGGSPVNDVKVSLSGSATGSGITNQDGRAIIQVVPQSAGTISILATGTGFADGSTTMTSTGTQGLAIASSQATVTAGVPSYLLFTVTSGNNAVSDATVNLTGVATGTGVTNQNGQVIMQINSTGSGSFSASVNKQGYSSGSMALSASGQAALAVSANPSNIANGILTYVTFTVMSGNSAVGGATVSVSGGGISTDGMTNSAGQVTLQLNSGSAGTINVIARKTGFVDGLTTLAH
ncbi:MAG: hypothetical protein J5U17_05020 [Candidatus Methanoperedens sp.]|nr:hypothetical protein [Candidatus Methanoperedens sp.]